MGVSKGILYGYHKGIYKGSLKGSIKGLGFIEYDIGYCHPQACSLSCPSVTGQSRSRSLGQR